MVEGVSGLIYWQPECPPASLSLRGPHQVRCRGSGSARGSRGSTCCLPGTVSWDSFSFWAQVSCTPGYGCVWMLRGSSAAVAVAGCSTLPCPRTASPSEGASLHLVCLTPLEPNSLSGKTKSFYFFFFFPADFKSFLLISKVSRWVQKFPTDFIYF